MSYTTAFIAIILAILTFVLAPWISFALFPNLGGLFVLLVIWYVVAPIMLLIGIVLLLLAFFRGKSMK